MHFWILFSFSSHQVSVSILLNASLQYISTNVLYIILQVFIQQLYYGAWSTSIESRQHK